MIKDKAVKMAPAADRKRRLSYIEDVQLGFAGLLVAGATAHGPALVPLGGAALVPAPRGRRPLVPITQTGGHVRVTAGREREASPLHFSRREVKPNPNHTTPKYRAPTTPPENELWNDCENIRFVLSS